MARKRFTTEQIIGLLREAEVRLGQGQAIGTICRGIGISEQSYYRWRRDSSGRRSTSVTSWPPRARPMNDNSSRDCFRAGPLRF